MQAAGLLLGKCSESSSLRIRDTLWNMLETGLCPTLRQAVQCCLVRLIVTSPRVFFEGLASGTLAVPNWIACSEDGLLQIALLDWNPLEANQAWMHQY